jgi:hypothetical protein
VRAGEGQDRPDPARETQARRDPDDVLRRALHAVVDPVQPADDGLIRILRRLTTPSPVRQVTLLVAECADLARLIAIWLEPAFTGVMRARRCRAGYRRGWPDQATRAPLRPAGSWLRPALVVASAVTIVVTGVAVLGQVGQIVTRASLNTRPGASIPAHAGAHSAGGGRGRSPTATLAWTAPARTGTTPVQAGLTSHRPGTTPAPSPAITPSASPTAGPSQSPEPTPTPGKTNHGHHQPHPGQTKSPPGAR